MPTEITRKPKLLDSEKKFEQNSNLKNKLMTFIAIHSI